MFELLGLLFLTGGAYVIGKKEDQIKEFVAELLDDEKQEEDD